MVSGNETIIHKIPFSLCLTSKLQICPSDGASRLTPSFKSHGQKQSLTKSSSSLSSFKVLMFTYDKVKAARSS